MATRKFGYFDFRTIQPTGLKASTGANTQTGADTTVDVFTAPGGSFALGHIGAATLMNPTLAAAGWLLPNDATDNEGFELAACMVSSASHPGCFTVGTDPAFYARVVLTIPVVVGATSVPDPMFFGFRTAGGLAGTPAAAMADLVDANSNPYADNVGLTVQGAAVAAKIYATQNLGGTGGTNTDTTLTLANATRLTLELRVSATGVVTGYVGQGAAAATIITTPANGIIATLTNALVVTPSLIFVQAATTGVAPTIESFTWGIQ